MIVEDGEESGFEHRENEASEVLHVLVAYRYRQTFCNTTCFRQSRQHTVKGKLYFMMGPNLSDAFLEMLEKHPDRTRGLAFRSQSLNCARFKQNVRVINHKSKKVEKSFNFAIRHLKKKMQFNH